MNHFAALRMGANCILGVGMGGRAAAYVLFFAARHLFWPFALVGAGLMIFGLGMYAGGFADFRRASAEAETADGE